VHIPDGFIPLSHALVYYIMALIIMLKAFKWVFSHLHESRIPLISMLAAAVFALQALNIPIPWGTSGHLLGAAMIAIIFGTPYAGIVVIALVLFIQTFLFGDGGYTAYGANLLAMGIVASYVGYYFFTWTQKITKKLTLAVFFAAWFSIVMASVIIALMLGVAGTFPFKLGLFYMGLYHLIIGVVVEGGISVLVIHFLVTVKPDAVDNPLFKETLI